MYIGRVTGTVVATIKNELFERHKLLVVDKLDLTGQATSKYDIALDMVQAGLGDLVLVLDEGNSARQVVDREPRGAIRAVIVGFVDEVEIEGSTFDVPASTAAQLLRTSYVGHRT
jgi:microcompartment protein CcmK/EutM